MPLDLKKDDMGDVIKDFYKSKAPQFKGKSKKKRREMAIAAKLSAERGPLPEEDNPRIPRKKGQPANSKKHSDLYTDENPKGTIHGLGFKDVATAKASVSKIRNSSRSHAHKIQAAVAMEQRAREMGKTSEAAVFRKYINAMKKKTKKMNEGWSDKYKKSIDCNNPKGFSQRAHCQGKKKKVSEEPDYKSRDKILKKAKPLHKHLYKNLLKKDTSGDVNETAYYKTDKYNKKVADAEKRNKEKDKRMKFGKFYDKAKEARDRLRPGEVKRYDKKLGRYVSNKE